MKVIRRRKKRKFISFALIVSIIGGYGYWTLGRPLPLIYPSAVVSTIQSAPQTANLAWPSKGQSAVAIVNTKILATNGAQTPVPIASTAKMITTLAVLEKKPLKLGESGPTITLNAPDVDLYNSYVVRQGSVVPVAVGEQITEYQMLQAILIPSANNMADSLAIWAFGSLENYKLYANDFVKRIGLKTTTVGNDASGLHPSTTSTAHDLVKLGELIIKNPVTAQIVAQSTASGIPIANTITSTNFLLGSDGIIGIKTGNSNEAGGVFVSASKTTVNQKPLLIITAQAGETNSFNAMRSSQALIRSAQTNFKPTKVVTGGTKVGEYRSEWGSQAVATASQDSALPVWLGSTVRSKTSLQPLSPKAKAGQIVGSIDTASSALNDRQTVPVKLQNSLSPPTTWWRLTHP